MEKPPKTKKAVKSAEKVYPDPKKKWGQNFLVNESALRAIVKEAGITKDDTVLEIGSGTGLLTRQLCAAAGRVISVEIDQDLISICREALSGYDNYDIIRADVMKLDLKTELENRGIKKVKVCANLPYYIATPVLIKLFRECVPSETITVTVQKEVAERMVSMPGNRDYGVLTLIVEYYSEASILFEIPKESFMPIPKVDSAVVRLNMRKEAPVNVRDEEVFFYFIKAAFSRRRKTLINSLKGFSLPRSDKALADDNRRKARDSIPQETPDNHTESVSAVKGDDIGLKKSHLIQDVDLLEILRSMGLDADIRAERLSLSQFARIFNRLYETCAGVV